MIVIEHSLCGVKNNTETSTKMVATEYSIIYWLLQYCDSQFRLYDP